MMKTFLKSQYMRALSVVGSAMSVVALISASSASLWWIHHTPKVPESLILKD